MFSAGLGLTWLATVPPTAGLVGKLFGPRYLGTLFGLTLLSHQLGGFFGAWVGGLVMERFGDYSWMWYADMALAAARGCRQPADPREPACFAARGAYALKQPRALLDMTASSRPACWQAAPVARRMAASASGPIRCDDEP